MRAINSPVLGDSTYGKKDPFGVGRPLLHAAEISFLHPVSAEEMHFTSRPPADFRHALDAFRAQNPDAAPSGSL